MNFNSKYKYLFSLLSLIVYGVLFLISSRALQGAAIAFTIIPIFVIAFYFGRWGALFSGILLIPSNVLLFVYHLNILSNPLKQPNFVMAHLALLAVGFVLGYLNQLRSKLNEELEYRKHREIELQQAQENASAADRTKKEFLANMSHEIRTPMNGIIGMIEILTETGLTDEQIDLVDSVRFSADALMILINDILDISKIEAGKLEIEEIDFDLRMMLEDLSRVMALTAEDKGIEFISLIYGNVPTRLKSDPGRIRQILTNLAGNAIKFTKEGEVTIRVSVETNTDTQAMLLFEVADTGIGIPQDRLERLFKPFSQVDASTTRLYGGTGLGLSISKQLTELMGGKIWIESEEGVGTSFFVKLPILKQPPLLAATYVVPDDLKGQKIIVADKNSFHREVMIEYLKEWECRFEETDSGQDILHKLQVAVQSEDPFKAVIMEKHLADMNGDELGGKIRNNLELKSTAMIMVTSVGQRGDVALLQSIGFAAFLSKPVKKAELFDCTRLVLGRHDNFEDDPASEIITRYSLKEKEIAAGILDAGEDPKKAQTVDRPLDILLAEDNPMNQKVAVKMLSKLGHTITIANNGKEAVESFEANNFDLVLMDVQMPEMDGIAATVAIRKREVDTQERIPIIALTASAMKGDKERFLAAGMDDYLSKPFKKDDLVSTIQKLSPN